MIPAHGEQQLDAPLSQGEEHVGDNFIFCLSATTDINTLLWPLFALTIQDILMDIV